MTNDSTKPDSLQPAAYMAVDLFDNWFDPIETEVQAQSRQFIEELLPVKRPSAMIEDNIGLRP
jgi:putative transposase